jgi:predicted ABC-class ATPase
MRLIRRIGAYKRLLGSFTHTDPKFTLSVDHVQGDPYASPSRVRAIMPWQETGLPNAYLESDIRRTALCDFLTRVVADYIRFKHMDRNIGNDNGGWAGPKGK